MAGADQTKGLDTLSPAQRTAATHPGHTLIAACPGSGKTTVLKYRAEVLLRTEPSAHLGAVTFTKDAADSLKAKIAEQYPAGAKRLLAGTFHSLCKQQLQDAGERFKICSRSAPIIAQAMANCRAPDAANYDFDDHAAAIASWQRQLDPQVPPGEQSALGYVYRAYTAYKRHHGLLDFDDMVRNAVLGMKAGRIKPLDLRFLLVDEFQDTDAMQLEWVLEHAKAGVDVTIVGDDDQSIYGFRGSLGYEGMLRFQSETDAQVINLDRTYRCSLQVLQPAAVLIEHNVARVPKKLITASTALGEARARAMATREAEADAVIEAILESGNPSAWGILARTNTQLEVIESRISGRFPYTIKDGSSFWELRGPDLLLGLASSIADGSMIGVADMLSRSGISNGVLDHLNRLCDFGRPGALDRFGRLQLDRRTDRDGYLAHTQNLARDWREQVQTNNQREMVQAINGMANHVLKHGRWTAKQTDDIRRRLENAAASMASVRGSLAQRLRTLTQKHDKQAGEGASLMSMHASKGLEWDNVWIVGCDVGTVPQVREGSEESEERRLLYVAMTRARKFLTLSYCLDKGYSPFLKECGLVGGSVLSKNVQGAAYG